VEDHMCNLSRIQFFSKRARLFNNVSFFLFGEGIKMGLVEVVS